MLYIIYQGDRDDGAAIRAANKDAHFAYLEKHRDIPQNRDRPSEADATRPPDAGHCNQRRPVVGDGRR